MIDLSHDPTAWVLVSFLILVFVGFKFGRKPIAETLDKKIAEIRQAIQTAETTRLEAQAALANCQRQTKNAEKEAEKIVQNARLQAAEIVRQAETDLHATIERREKQLEERLNRMKETAAAEIRARAAELALRAAQEIIASRMDESENARIVDESIAGLPKRLAG